LQQIATRLHSIIFRHFEHFVIHSIVELKKGERFSKKNIDQVMKYLNVSNLKLAMLINFTDSGVVYKRIINFDS